jgi:LPS O-antigen subunit length determinant protein (WzzB/FepE family)
MANQNITRYDLEQAEEPDGDARMVVNQRGDYVAWDLHEEIVDELQNDLDAAKKVIAEAIEKLKEI